jgi:cytochrome c oxidase subunit 2
VNVGVLRALTLDSLGLASSQGDWAESPFDPASPQARAIRDLFVNTLLVCGAVFLLVTGMVAYCAFLFRGRSREPSAVEGHTRLEIAWTVGPILVIAWLLVLTIRAMDGADPPVDRDPDVTIIGHQWWWEARYPSGVVTANEIHIPIGKPLAVRLESSDVIHDFWVPELGRKMDVIPGRPSSIWLQADKAGDYTGACAEYCGVQHAWMRILVVAQSPEDFAAWERRQLSPPPSPAGGSAEARGAETFNTMTCVRCHAVGASPNAARFAPDLTHLASRSILGAGVVPNTPADLSRWLAAPQTIKEGCHMPDAQLTQAQVADLVAYFETLR